MSNRDCGIEARKFRLFSNQFMQLCSNKGIKTDYSPGYEYMHVDMPSFKKYMEQLNKVHEEKIETITTSAYR